MYVQILLDGSETIVYSKAEWKEKLQEWCDEHCTHCGYEWFCEMCENYSCSETIMNILEDHNIPIDFSSLDFSYYVKRANEVACYD